MTAMGQPDPDLGPAQTGSAATVRGVALLARFLIEIALFVGVGYSVDRASDGGWQRGVVAACAVVAVAVVWAAFLSPRAPYKSSRGIRVAVEAVLFGGCGAALWALGHPWAGAALAAVWAVDRVVLASVRPVT